MAMAIGILIQLVGAHSFGQLVINWELGLLTLVLALWFNDYLIGRGLLYWMLL